MDSEARDLSPDAFSRFMVDLYSKIAALISKRWGKQGYPCCSHHWRARGVCVEFTELVGQGLPRSRSLTERHEGGPRSERAELGLSPSGLFTRSCGTAPFRQTHAHSMIRDGLVLCGRLGWSCNLGTLPVVIKIGDLPCSSLLVELWAPVDHHPSEQSV